MAKSHLHRYRWLFVWYPQREEPRRPRSGIYANGLRYMIGGLLFGIATLRAGILPRWPADLLAFASCAKDAEAKAAGQDGCGCGTAEASATAPVAATGIVLWVSELFIR